MDGRRARTLLTLALVLLVAGCSSSPSATKSEFHWNTGTYLAPPDVVASQPGAPITIMSCGDDPLIVYAYSGRWVADCSGFELMAVNNPNVAMAGDIASLYARTQVSCEHGCEKSMRYVWAGWDCRNSPSDGPPGRPWSDSAAVELEVRCTTAREPVIEGIDFADPPPMEDPFPAEDPLLFEDPLPDVPEPPPKPAPKRRPGPAGDDL